MCSVSPGLSFMWIYICSDPGYCPFSGEVVLFSGEVVNCGEITWQCNYDCLNQLGSDGNSRYVKLI
jgi:hypothetical protein